MPAPAVPERMTEALDGRLFAQTKYAHLQPPTHACASRHQGWKVSPEPMASPQCLIGDFQYPVQQEGSASECEEMERLVRMGREMRTHCRMEA